jgi:hypothetical protein
LGAEAADLLCCSNPARVVDGNRDIAMVRVPKRRTFASWFPWRKAA